MADRPNILFLMSDEHRADVAGYAGDDVVRTPTLDWLAETGTVFENAYTPSPLCMPARQCLMAGQLPETVGCRSYGEDLPPESMTWARQFSRHAYTTTCVGKLHHMGKDQMQGWSHRPFGDMTVSPEYMEETVEAEFDRYEAPDGIGGWTNNEEIKRAGPKRDRYMTFDARVRTVTEDVVTKNFLSPTYDRTDAHHPQLLKVSLLQPHYPYFTDRERFEYYLNRVPVYNDEPLFDHPVLSRTQAGPEIDVSHREAQRATAAYYGRIETVDDHYADVLDALRDAGEDLDEWIIVYCSDHGEMLGEHGIWEKTRFFEASARVPLIIRYPERFDPGTVEANVNLCDLFATLCDLAGIETPAASQAVGGAGLDSRSLVPLMEGRTDEWTSRYDNETVTQVHGHLMIKRDDLKYCWYPEAPEVLFDLERDPGETTNVVEDPAYEEEVARFRERRGELGFGPNADPEYENAGYAT